MNGGIIGQHGSLLAVVFGDVGQYIFLCFLLILFAGGRISNFLNGFKKFKAGPMEVEARGDEATSCPHKDCKDMRDRAFTKVWERIDDSQTDRDRIRIGMDVINSKLDIMQVSINQAFDSIKELKTDQMKLVFYNDDMPVPERIVGGLRYVSEGYNHEMKRDVIAFCSKYPTEYSAVVAVAPKLKLNETSRQGQNSG